METDEIAPGTVIAGFEFKLPVDDVTCRAQIAATLVRGLPEAVLTSSRRKLVVIANGPSARGVDLKAIDIPTLALNGSMRLFMEQGIAPTYWACCDPQALVADFVPDSPPAETVYFVASKCHASVFEKLNGRDVRVWHLMDYPADDRERIALCSSVTLSGSWLMHRLGFTDFEFWGWDGCFMDGRHHASGDAEWNGKDPNGNDPLYINYGGKFEAGEIIGGRNFPTTKTWAAEAQGAEQFFRLAEYLGIGVKVHGDGMFNCLQQTLEEAA